jgi:hypothetical protein
VERYQDYSGKSTYYRYGERQHLVAVTDALSQTTTLSGVTLDVAGSTIINLNKS